MGRGCACQCPAVTKLAKEVGISTEDIELLRKDPEGFRQWKAERESKEKKPEFPKGVSTNPDRRERSNLKLK